MSELQPAFPSVFNRILSTKRKDEHQVKLELLKKDLDVVKTDLHTALANFDNVTDQNLIDFYIYQIQSAEVRYDHLIKEIKQL